MSKLITLTDFFYWYFNKSDSGHEQTDHINRMITLTVITLSAFTVLTIVACNNLKSFPQLTICVDSSW